VATKLSSTSEWELDKIKSIVNTIAKEENVKFVQIVKPLRIALTGQLVGVDLFHIMHLLGKSQTTHRLSKLFLRDSQQ
jgi:glutamyl-tRNA synthetase